MSNLLTRTITGLVFILVLGFCSWFSNISFLLLFSVVSVVSLFEFYKMLRRGDVVVFALVGAICGLLILVLNFLFLYRLLDLKFLSLILLIIPGVMISGLYTNQKDPVRAISWTLLGIFYVTVPFCLFMHIGFLPDFQYQPYRILGMLVILWSTDTFAYIFGKMLGKHKMFPRISPNKSWEGAIGGALGGIGASLLVQQYFPQSGAINWIVVAILIIIFGIFGDLVESLFKRKLELKDSGDILPGHGGLLDRFDSMIGFSPFVYVYLFLLL